MLRKLVRRLRRREGFTLIELMVVVAILALLAAIAAPKISEVINRSKEARQKADLKVISGAIERYYNDKGHYPIKLQDMIWEGYLKADTSFQNGWGKNYFYAVDDNTVPQHYVLGDPGSTPNATAKIYTAANGSIHADALPEGRGHDQVPYGWKVPGPGAGDEHISVVKEDGTDFTAAELPYSLARYCDTWSEADKSCTTWFDPARPYRYDLLTD